MIRFLTIFLLSCVACFAQVNQSHLTNTSANVQLQLNNRVMRVATLAALKALPAVQVASGALVSTAGYTTAGDGGGALYRYDSSSTATANDGSVILPTHGTGRYILSEPIQSFLQWGVVAGSTAAASNNAVRMTAAIRSLTNGGHLVLPKLSQSYYIGPNSIRPALTLSNLVLELHGTVEVPATPVWNATHPSLFHFADAGVYNNLTIFGSATIYGNATNQTSASTNNYGKQNCFWIGNSTNMSLSGLTIRGFGGFAALLTSVNGGKVSHLTVRQTDGNNDTLPTRWGVNADGVHTYESQNVMVSDCDIESTDDCVAFTINVSGTISSNYTVANCILRPFAGSQFVPSGIRLSLESGVVNSTIANVLIANNIIRPAGANGMYIGTAANQLTRELSGIKIIGNIIDRAGFDPIQIGPSAGTNVTHNAIATGGITVVHANDVEIGQNLIINSRAKGIVLANVGTAIIRGNTISNVVDSWTGGAPRGVGIYTAQGSYGNNDDITIDGNTITGTDGGSIYSDGSTWTTSVMQIKNNVLNDWLRGQYASSGRSHPAISGPRNLTNYISGNRFSNGKGSSIVLATAFANAKHEISDNSFQSSQAVTASVGGTEQVRVTYTTAGAIGGQLTLANNRIGDWRGRGVVLENLLNTYILGNSFLPDTMDASVSPEMVYLNYGTGTTGAATLMVANNVAHIASKAGANPSVFARAINNNGSGGSSVTLASSVAQNVITPASGMAHFLDGFASGARDIAYGATTTIPNSSEIPIRNRVTLAGNTTLAWTNPFPGQRGTLDVYPDTVARVITLPSLAYSPTGSTITNSGGTGSTNWTRLNWEVHQVGGTNRIFVQPTDVYR